MSHFMIELYNLAQLFLYMTVKAAVSQILTILSIFYFTLYVCSNVFSGW